MWHLLCPSGLEMLKQAIHSNYPSKTIRWREMWQSTSSTALNTAQLTDHFTLIQMVSEQNGGGKWSGEKVMDYYPW